ncbi:(+)-neomenthol dehydrogenase-like [Castanea sativa]|uniref:(+)-neomenthol dehydrogenase-like n=1 Tax=Castanea sativa TaxID=21020 RepID=UPI003F64EFDE
MGKTTEEANRAFKGVGVRADWGFGNIKVADGTGQSTDTSSTVKRFFLNAAGDLEISKKFVLTLTLSWHSCQFINNERAKAVLENVNDLTEEKIDEILQWFLRDFNDQNLEANGWPKTVSAYKVSRAAVNAYTKLIAKRFPQYHINSIHPEGSKQR